MTTKTTTPTIPWEHLGVLIPSEKARKYLLGGYLLTLVAFQATETFLLNSAFLIPSYFSGIQATMNYLAIPVVAVAFANVRNPEEKTVAVELDNTDNTENSQEAIVEPFRASVEANLIKLPKHAIELTESNEAPEFPNLTTFKNEGKK